MATPLLLDTNQMAAVLVMAMVTGQRLPVQLIRWKRAVAYLSWTRKEILFLLMNLFMIFV